MSSAQKRAIQKYRSRLGAKGLARFEVLARNGDRNLIRSLARQLSKDTPAATELRAAVNRAVAGTWTRTGGVVAALRRSPLVGAGLDLSRPREPGRDVDL